MGCLSSGSSHGHLQSVLSCDVIASLRCLRLFHAVAGQVQLDNHAVVDEPVNGCRRRHRVPEELLPAREGQIAHQQHAAPFIAVGQEREEEFHLLAALLDVAQVVDQDRVVSPRTFEHPRQRYLLLGSEITFGEVTHQRCIFHKMANVLDALKMEPGMTPEQKRERRVEVARALVKVWEGSTEAEIQAKLQEFVAEWQKTQPEAAAKLQADFGSTTAYLRVQEEVRREGQEWETRFLRTTSSLERTNRSIREKVRKAGVFQTSEGLRANAFLAAGCRGKRPPGWRRQWLPGVMDGEHALG